MRTKETGTESKSLTFISLEFREGSRNKTMQEKIFEEMLIKKTLNLCFQKLYRDTIIIRLLNRKKNLEAAGEKLFVRKARLSKPS